MATISVAAQFEDDILIKQVLEGDAESFTILLNRHIGSVRRRIRSMVRNTFDVEDLFIFLEPIARY